MGHMLSIEATISRLLAQEPPEKTAAVVEDVPVKDTKSILKKVAARLREEPELELTYPILHVVKKAMIEGTLGPLPEPFLILETGSVETQALRKLSNALREEDQKDHSRLLAKGAHALRATKGIMLLRELVRE